MNTALNPGEESTATAATYGFPCVRAEPQPHLLPRYRGNPLIEALRFPASERELKRALSYVPVITDEMRSAEASWRRLSLHEFKRFRFALDRHVALAEMVYGGMCESLMGRVPQTPAYVAKLTELYQLKKSNAAPTLHSNGAEFAGACVGKAGCGKTFAMDAVAGLFGATPVIHHPSLNHWQIPILRLSMPYLGASRKTLGMAIILKLDELFPEGNYRRIYIEQARLRSGDSSNAMMLNAFMLLQVHTVGYVLIDDATLPEVLQESVSKKDRDEAKRTPLAALLIAFSNEARVPVLFNGTPDFVKTMGTSYSMLRRSHGTPWGPLSIQPGFKGFSEFEAMFRVLWSLQLLRNPLPWSERMQHVFYTYSFGIPDTLVKLFTAVQQRALSTGQESITEPLVHQVAMEDMGSLTQIALAHQDLKSAAALDRLNRMSDLRAEFSPHDKPSGEFGRVSAPQWNPDEVKSRLLGKSSSTDAVKSPSKKQAGTQGAVPADSGAKTGTPQAEAKPPEDKPDSSKPDGADGAVKGA